jgi:hypothetical protein
LDPAHPPTTLPEAAGSCISSSAGRANQQGQPNHTVCLAKQPNETQLARGVLQLFLLLAAPQSTPHSPDGAAGPTPGPPLEPKTSRRPHPHPRRGWKANAASPAEHAALLLVLVLSDHSWEWVQLAQSRPALALGESETSPARGSLVSAQAATLTLSLVPARPASAAGPASPATVLAGYKSCCRGWRCKAIGPL